MPSKSSKPGYYAVQNGRSVGIYHTWAECEAQTKGWPNAKYKKFNTMNEAQQYISLGSAQTSTSAPLPSASQRSLSSTTTDDSKGKKREFGIEVADTTGWDVVYSDGACKGNGKPGSVAGIGVWWGYNDERNIAERCPGDQTNNRAELIAIMRVLETTPISKTPLLIRTDSQYSMNCFKNWLPGWQRNGWKTKDGNPVKNDGIIRCISAYMNIRGKVGQKVMLEYVKGHSGDPGNDGADLMANRGSTLSELPDRDWKALEGELEEQIRDLDNDTPIVMPDILYSPPEEEHPNKIRKLSSQNSTAIPSSLPTRVTQHNPPAPTPAPKKTVIPPMKVICADPPLVAVREADINFEDFADCILDDEDLANELLE